jgi:hypothetical protein
MSLEGLGYLICDKELEGFGDGKVFKVKRIFYTFYR